MAFLAYFQGHHRKLYNSGFHNFDGVTHCTYGTVSIDQSFRLDECLINGALNATLTAQPAHD